MRGKLLTLDSYKNLYSKIRAKGPLVSIAIAATLFLVLTSGVGVTLAATGVIQISENPTPTPSSPSSTEQPTAASAQPQAGSGVELPENIFNGGNIDESALKRAGASGWTGVRVYFDNQNLGAVIGARPNQSNGWFDIAWTFDGRTSSAGSTCARDTSGTCLMYIGGPSIGQCKDGYEYSIRVWGSGFETTQSGRIPAGVSYCPAPPAPTAPFVSPQNTAPPAPEPTPSQLIADTSSSPSPGQ